MRAGSAPFAWLFAASLLLPCLGCTQPTGNVSGKVTFNGKPVTAASILMCGRDGRPHTAHVDANGRYTIKDMPVGTFQVAVVSRDPEIQLQHLRIQSSRRLRAGQPGITPTVPLPPEKQKAHDEMEAKLKAEKARWFPLPPKYADPLSSGLTCEVKPGENTFDIQTAGIAEEAASGRTKR